MTKQYILPKLINSDYCNLSVLVRQLNPGFEYLHSCCLLPEKTFQLENGGGDIEVSF